MVVNNPSQMYKDYNKNYPSGSPKKVIKSYNKKYGVCGRGNYVKKAFNRQDEDENPCNKCPELRVIKSKEADIKKTGVLNDYPEIPSYDQLYKMCEINNVTFTVHN